MKAADAIFRFARSVRLTLVLAAILIALCIFDSVFPGRGVFRSPFFLVPVALLFLNLLACTLFRFFRELNKKAGRNFAPDILHAALLVFMVAACISGFLRVDMAARLFAGDAAALPNGGLLVVEALSAETYEDGRPKDWTSRITVRGGAGVLAEGYDLRVNHPLRADNLTFYQYSWGVAAEGEYTVIRVVWDPGMNFVIASLLLVGAGVFVVLYAKLLRGRGTTDRGDDGIGGSDGDGGSGRSDRTDRTSVSGGTGGNGETGGIDGTSRSEVDSV